MIFDRHDYEFLKLCGLCRYLPVGLAGSYDAPYFSGSVISILREHGLIKIQSDRLSYKLTFAGREILAGIDVCSSKTREVAETGKDLHKP